jgi:hypothetical protein
VSTSAGREGHDQDERERGDEEPTVGEQARGSRSKKHGEPQRYLAGRPLKNRVQPEREY